jgi:hypothetical protein
MRSSSDCSRGLSRGRQQKWTNSGRVRIYASSQVCLQTIISLVQIDVAWCGYWLYVLLVAISALIVSISFLNIGRVYQNY